MQSRVPLGPGKFHVVVLVSLRLDFAKEVNRYFLENGHGDLSFFAVLN